MRILLVTLLTLAACRSIDVEVASSSASRYPPTDPATIESFHAKSEVPRPFEELAIVSYHAKNPGEDTVHARVHEEAARLGAHAVVWMRGDGVVYGPFGVCRQVDGWAAAIRYR